MPRSPSYLRTSPPEPLESTKWCPSCEATQIVRSDSGLCERCHAVRPETVAEWMAWRQECEDLKHRREDVLPEGYCTTCHRPWYADSQDLHDKYCPAKPVVCDCTRRFWNNNELTTHRRFNSCGGNVILGRSPL